MHFLATLPVTHSVSRPLLMAPLTFGQTIPDSPVMTESNHTPIHNGLLFDGVRCWPGQQLPNIRVLLRMTLQSVRL